MSEPRTEAGKRLLEDWQTEVRITKSNKRLMILAIETEAAGVTLRSEPLDVERLAKALRGGKPCGDPNCPSSHMTYCDNEIASIAAEYAAQAIR